MSSYGLDAGERRLLERLSTPAKVQDFLETIPVNFEPEGDTCLSPRRVLRERRAHCIEGALLAALALRLHGYRPLVMHLASTRHDYDHVVAVWQGRHGWGAISKTNHAVLRYREPIYRTVRELAMSYFHEYFTDDGKKQLRGYSNPVNLARFDKSGWMTDEEDLWYIPEFLADAKHYPLVPKSLVRHLRSAEPLEVAAGKLIDWKKNTRSHV